MGRYGNEPQNSRRWYLRHNPADVAPSARPGPSRAQLEPASGKKQGNQQFCKKNNCVAAFYHADLLGPVAAMENGTASKTGTKGELKPLLKITL